MDNVFYNLNVLSSYSLLSSTLSIDDIIDFSVNNNLKYAVLTDRNLYGAIEFYHKCIDKKIKPVIGLNYCYKNSNYLFIAKNNNGYHNLIKIHSLTNLEKDFNIQDLINDLFIIHIDGDHLIKSDSYYLANEVALHTSCCLEQNDFETLKVLKAIELNINDLQEMQIDNINFLQTYEVAKKTYSQKQIELNKQIIESCDWVLEKSKPHLAKFNIPNESSTERYLFDSCLKGLKNRLGNNIVDKKYVDRLNYELSVIHEMGFDDYFLIVSDFVNYAKSKNILIGPGRGSAAGSLVAYCLNITDLDPIENNLIFERFLNPERKSLPDIDIDVMDIRRQELIDYIFDKYGPDNTSYIITFQRIKSKMAIRDVGRVLNIDLRIIDRITKTLTIEQENDLSLCFNSANFKDFIKEYPKLFEIAKKIINIPRQVSTHAAGIIISDKPLYEYIPVQVGIDGWHLSEFSMEHLEGLGLFKMDILGLKNLSIINDVLELIKKNKNIDLDLNKINHEDQKLFDDLSSGNTIGIFQLESPGMRNTIMKVKPKSIEDISICSALFRPGPQALIPDYVKTREGKLPEKYLNEKIKETFKVTLGFCVYQEQVIELIRTVTNFSLGQADIFRRAISKKKVELFEKMRSDFIQAAITNNYSQKEANEIYDFILEFANYGFNHSHSLAYSYISYQMMYLKYYYPLEFYMVLLSYGDTTKNNLYLSQAKKKHINIMNVSITKSKQNFSIYEDNIIFGFSNIKGIGIEIANKIFNTQQSYNFDSWSSAISILGRQDGISKKTIELLIKVGAFDEFNVDRNFLLLNIDEILLKENIVSKKTKTNVFDLEISNDYEPMSEKEKAEWEFELLSYTFSNNQWEQMFNKYAIEYKLDKIANSNDEQNARYLVLIRNLKETKTKYGKKMCFVEFSESDVDYNCASFSETIFTKLVVNKYAIVSLKGIKTNKVQLVDVVCVLED